MPIPPPNSDPRAWQRMLSGRRLDLINPSPQDIEIEDIAHGLARVARWNGQTTGDHALSVAQHSLIVEEIFTAQCDLSSKSQFCRIGQVAALLHDAPEYVIGDMISPFKNVLGPDYQKFERQLQRAIHLRFSLPEPLPKEIVNAIKVADRISAYFEATALAGFEPVEAGILFGDPQNISGKLLTALLELSPWPALRAQEEFLQRFAQLKTSVR